MAQPITALAGNRGVITVNGQTAKLTKWSVRVSNDVIKYATTGQTAGANTTYWMNKLAGMNDAVIDVEGYWDSNTDPAAKWTGATYLMRPGTTAAGTITCGFKTGDVFSGAGVVGNIEAAGDAESNKPQSFRATFEVDGELTFPS